MFENPHTEPLKMPPQSPPGRSQRTCPTSPDHRRIIHLNIADFAATLEGLAAPALKSRPLVIAPLGAPRAVVYDMNETAFKEGIQKGMPLALALRRVPGLALLPPRYTAYERVMQDILKKGLRFTPTVEPGSGDGHLFLDVTGTGRLFGPPVDVAFRLKKELGKSLGLDPIWSLATNKLVAKVASRMVKPVGEYIVGPGEEAAFLKPLPLALLPGLSPGDQAALADFNLDRVSQALDLTRAQLAVPLGRRAALFHDWIRGRDHEPVHPELQGQTDRLRHDHCFDQDTNGADTLRAALHTLAISLAAALRTRGCAAAVLGMGITHSDTICRAGRRRLTQPAWDEAALFREAHRLLTQIRTRRVRIRHLSLECTRTAPCHVQADLFSQAPMKNKQDRITPALDRIRKKFGTGAVAPGASLPPSPAPGRRPDRNLGNLEAADHWKMGQSALDHPMDGHRPTALRAKAWA